MRTPIVAVISLGCACGPATPGDSRGESSTGGSMGEPTTTTTTTTTPTTGAPDACGPPPASPACDGGVSDPHAPLCGARDQADCAGPLTGDDSIVCRWVTTAIFAADATSCAAPTPAGTCIATMEFGDGCEVPTTCPDARDGRTYYRVTADCSLEVFTTFFCGASVLGWQTCAWTATASPECATPWPSQGPAVCNCAC